MAIVRNTLVSHTDSLGKTATVSVDFDDATLQIKSLIAASSRTDAPTRASIKAGGEKADAIDGALDLTARALEAKVDREGAIIFPFAVQFAP